MPTEWMRCQVSGVGCQRGRRVVAVAFAWFAFFLSTPAEPLKVICASRAAPPPVIDGRLDDACWQAAEVRSDFGSPGDGSPVARLTTMRFAYDDQNLYMGLEFLWDDVSILNKGIAEILAAHGPPAAGACAIKQYDNRYGVELFIDPGATAVNYYQILFNAAGQHTGNYKMMWNEFKGGQSFKATIHDSRWTVEYVYPAKGLKAGDEWGLNLCRNDETYYSMWKQVGGAYHAPHLFGRIVIGSYAEWWNAVWTTGAAARLQTMESGLNRYALVSPTLDKLYATAKRSADVLHAVAEQHPPDGRANFEALYPAYKGFQKDLSRLANAYETAEQMVAAGRKGRQGS